MTIQEAIEDIREGIKPIVGGKSLEIAIECMEEVEQYRALGTPTQILERIGGLDVELGKYHCLGTVEELKEAREKQRAKKPIETEHLNCLNYECPICEGGLYHEQQYCDECGQALKWEEEDV